MAGLPPKRAPSPTSSPVLAPLQTSRQTLIEDSGGAHMSGFHPSTPVTSPSKNPLDQLLTPRSSSFRRRNSTGGPPREPFLIGVAGGTASGKTTVCDQIIQRLHDQRVVLVSQDSFYKGLTPEEHHRVAEYNFDHPDAFDSEAIISCLETLRKGKAVDIPIYDFVTHQRSTEVRKRNAADVIIMEGILVFHEPRVRNMFNMKIFVDTDADVRLARRIRRDTLERGRDVAGVIEQYAKFVKPAFDDFVLPTKKYADVIIPRGGDNHVAIDLIGQHIQAKLGTHDLRKIYPNLYIVPSTFQIRGMHTLIRDRHTTKHDFVFYADRLIRLVVEHGLGHLPFTEKQVVTPTGETYVGVDFAKRLCGVSIIRSGESMENALRACCKGVKIGKILIHREGDNGKQLIYEKLPTDIAERHVLLMDPILGTGNCASYAIELLLKKGVPQEKIVFLTLISAPDGVHKLCTSFPSLKLVTSEIDAGLNDDWRVVPGVGEFGDRYFGTDDDPVPTPVQGNALVI
ncbi:uridine kinase/uracil phosphoribosyltransferase [Klebsormidium nitens]|uniref:Uridine kinase n=1 Tax=Klebsormidium nitens TaxID=105231 RepID=A0A1Y1IPA1_KLENI|nr:uridine kinase/uracil phosphoribosyltransferase [Klebsormidium nitens]|eukprot:GAQ92715.1 uridine kinase/uracil phosphoribosyltransferase [Klebsormidium nitens]